MSCRLQGAQPRSNLEREGIMAKAILTTREQGRLAGNIIFLEVIRWMKIKKKTIEEAARFIKDGPFERFAVEVFSVMAFYTHGRRVDGDAERLLRQANLDTEKLKDIDMSTAIKRIVNAELTSFYKNMESAQ